MDFHFHHDRNYVPSNFFTSVVIGLTGLVLVTIAQLIPDASPIGFIVLVLIPCGWVCYLVSIVGIIINLFRLLQKITRVKNSHN